MFFCGFDPSPLTLQINCSLKKYLLKHKNRLATYNALHYILKLERARVYEPLETYRPRLCFVRDESNEGLFGVQLQNIV